MAYVAAHIAAHIVARLTTKELLPFSAFAMFSDVKNIFHAGTRKWIWLTTKPHAVGTLKNYCFPFARRPTVEVKELDDVKAIFAKTSRRMLPPLVTDAASNMTVAAA